MTLPMVSFLFLYVIPSIFLICFNHYEIKHSRYRDYTNGEYITGVLASLIPIANVLMTIAAVVIMSEKWLATPVKKGKLS